MVRRRAVALGSVNHCLASRPMSGAASGCKGKENKSCQEWIVGDDELEEMRVEVTVHCSMKVQTNVSVLSLL